MVVDLGGGTADITTYSIMDVDSEIKFRELVVGEGGKVGSTAVNRELLKFCVGKIGSKFARLPVHEIGPGSAFMNDFDDCKHAFEGPDGMEDLYKIHLRIPGQRTCKNYSEVEHAVMFTRYVQYASRLHAS